MGMRSTQPLKDAIAVYDAGIAARADAWDNVDNDADVMACEREDKRALDEVRAAFYELTKDRNSFSAAMLADLPFMRRVAERDGIEELGHD